MNNIERREHGLPYRADADIASQIKRCREILRELNHCDAMDLDNLIKITSRLFGKSDHAVVTPPFLCRYGFNIEAGKNFDVDFGCTILDAAKVTIGDYCMMGPNSSIYTVGHPLHPLGRRAKYEYCIPVTLGNDVLIGAGAVITPGVTIGDGCVIGVGSVVTHDLPAMSLCAGSPCRVIRPITDADRHFYFHNREFDAEALENMSKFAGDI